LLPPDLVVVDCVICGTMLQAIRPKAGNQSVLPVVEGRADGFCYCAACWDRREANQ
jgi:hypothetical protein